MAPEGIGSAKVDGILAPRDRMFGAHRPKTLDLEAGAQLRQTVGRVDALLPCRRARSSSRARSRFPDRQSRWSRRLASRRRLGADLHYVNTSSGRNSPFNMTDGSGWPIHLEIIVA